MSCLDLINATDDDTTPHTRASETVLGATLAVNGGIGCVLNAGVLAALWLMKSGGQPLCAMGVFIRSLTLSDTVYSLLGSLLQGIDATIGSWTMGPTLCRVHMFVGALAVNVSIGTMAAISIHRFLGVWRPQVVMTPLRARAMLSVVWLYCVGFALPNLFWSRDKNVGCGVKVCTLDDQVGLQWLYVHTVVRGATNFFLPLAITWTAYMAIIARLTCLRRQVGPKTSDRQNEIKLRVTRMCFILVSALTISWAPFQVYLLMRSLTVINVGVTSQLVMAMSTDRYVGRHVVMFLVSVNAVVNPLIHAIMWKPLRATISEV